MAQGLTNRQRQRYLLVATAGLVGALAVVAVAGSWAHAQIRAAIAWRRAMTHFAMDAMAPAKAALEECTSLWPDDAEAQFYLARACRRTGDERGKEHLLRAKHLVETSGVTPERKELARRIDLEFELIEAQYGDIYRVESALFGQLQAGHYDEILILEALAKGYLREHKLAKVVKCAGMWSDKYPRDWRAKYWWAYACELGADDDKAVKLYQAALKLFPDHFEAHHRLGALLRRNGQVADALPHLQFCYQRQPDNVEIVIETARCLRMLAQMDESQQVLDQWLARHGDQDAEVLEIRGELEHDMNGPASSLPWLRRAEKLAPRDYRVIALLARALRESGNKEEAEPYERSREESVKLLNRLEHIVAREILDDPDSVTLRREAGDILMRLGRPKQAMYWLKSVLEIEPNHPPTHRLLAEYYESIGEKDLARDHRATAEGKKRAILH